MLFSVVVFLLQKIKKSFIFTEKLLIFAKNKKCNDRRN